MTDKPVPDYYSINQLCEKWGFNLKQLQYTVETYNIRLWACITGENIKVFETKINAITFDDIKKFGLLTEKGLKHEGFVITLSEPNLFLAEKGSISFYIDYRYGDKRISFPHLNSWTDEIHHDGFVELCKQSSIDPRKKLITIFSEGKLFVLQVKCKKKGYIRFLAPVSIVKLEDIYVHQKEVYKIECKLKKISDISFPKTSKVINTPSPKNRKSPRLDVISEALVKVVFPALKEDGVTLIFNMGFAKLCWEKLSDALKSIGCTNVEVKLKGEQDLREFSATHTRLDLPAKNFKAFRRRLPTILDYYLVNL